MRVFPTPAQRKYLDELSALATAPRKSTDVKPKPADVKPKPEPLPPPAPTPPPMPRKVDSAWLDLLPPQLVQLVAICRAKLEQMPPIVVLFVVLLLLFGVGRAFGHEVHRHPGQPPRIERTVAVEPIDVEPAIVPPLSRTAALGGSQGRPISMTELIVVLGGPAFTLLLLLLWMAVRRRRNRRLLPRVPAKAAGRKIRPGAAADPVRDDKAGQAAPAKAGDGALVQAPGAWLLGLATHRGPVRPRNEDAGCAFTVGKHQVLVLADGVGGMPHGADASRAAVRAAERAIRQAWRVTPHGQEPLPRMMLSHAFAAAAARLASSGIARGFTSVAAGLRTTLIVVIGTADHFHFGHVGDGGINLVRGDGSAKSLFVPHKADPEVQNMLSASLGPVPQGAAVFGATERRRSDLLVAATDGVTDRVAPAFYGRTLLRQAARHAGDLTRTAQAVLERLSQHRDDGGLFAFDDNMTLGLMGDGRAPIDPAPAPRTLAREVA